MNQQVLTNAAPRAQVGDVAWNVFHTLLDPVERPSATRRRWSLQDEVSAVPTAAQRYSSVAVATEASVTVQKGVPRQLGPVHCAQPVGAINRVGVAAVLMPSANAATVHGIRK